MYPDLRGSSGGGMNLEIWFPQQNEVTVFLESSITDDDEERFYESAVFALYAARQIANLRDEGMSLALVLQSTDTSSPLNQTKERLDDVRVLSPTGGDSGRKGFSAKFRPEKRAYFKLHLHGFGMTGRGVGYYAPTSTLALLYWLLNRRKDDPVYQRALAATAENVGILGSRGQITVTSQAPLAMEATAAAWAEAQHAETLAGYGLTAEAERACDEHGIDFAELVSDASERLQDGIADLPGDGYTVLPDAIADLLTRLEVIGAAGLTEDDRFARAFAAVQAAEGTEDEAVIEAAYGHYDRALAELVEEHGLAPVTDALREVLFTSDVDEAAP